MTTTAPSTGAPLAPLRPIVRSPRSASEAPTRPSREPWLLSSLAPLEARTRRTLDFDIECVAAGFADPQWVPKRVTAWAFAWIDKRGKARVKVEALPVADMYSKDARREFLRPLLAAIAEADVVTGHNIIRFDLPTLNADCHNLDLPLLGEVAAQDTIRLYKTNGFKKGQDNMSHALGVRARKRVLSWAEWEEAYGEPGLVTVKARCRSDVRMHLEMRERMRERGWLKPPRPWKP